MSSTKTKSVKKRTATKKGAAMVQKSKTTAKNVSKAKRLPKFFSLANKNFVVLAIVIVAAVGIGSWKLYTTQAATDGKSHFPSTSQCNVFKPFLYKWVKNQDLCVKSVQHFMNLAGYNAGAVDGKYGPQTEAAVKQFQIDNGKFPTGTVDHPTWESIAYNCNRPAYFQQLRQACHGY